MAVTYVKDFSFPSDFGFSKNGSASVPGKAKGGRATTPQAYREGGKIQPPQTKYPGHTKGMPSIAKKGAGASDLKRPEYSDKGPSKTTSEKSSGMQAPAFKSGGKMARNESMMKSHMARRANGGAATAEAPVPMGKKSSWNKDDAVSPGSFKRTPPKQGAKNPESARDKFAAKTAEPATKQEGDVERMSGWSDFKKGGKVTKKKMGGGSQDRYESSDGAGSMSKDKTGTSKQIKGTPTYKSGGRIKNLGKYAHGGKVWKDGSTQKPGGDAKYEKAAGTPKRDHMSTKGEVESGKATGKSTAPAQGEKRMAQGGLSRATSPKRNAAIHAKSRKVSPGASLGALASVLGGAGVPHQPSAPGMGPSPPGMAPGMGSPPGGQMGAMRPQAPGPGAPAMAGGGSVRHVVIHHVKHG